MDTVALAAAAGATSTIGLISNIMIAPVWPAALLAKEVAGIDAVSGNRLTLGIGLGGVAMFGASWLLTRLIVVSIPLPYV